KAAPPTNSYCGDHMTPTRRVVSGRAASVRFSSANTVVQREAGAGSYFGLINSGELVLRTGNRFRFLELFRGSASIVDRRLTVLAETITPVTAPFENCGNPTCDCGDTILDHPGAIPHSNVSSIFRPRRERQKGSSSEPLLRSTRQKKKRKQ